MPDDIATQYFARESPTAARMQPVASNGWFGWLHCPRGGVTGGCAVVICSGLTHDQLSGHRSFRLLADELAADGYPVLRFDYPDTGDAGDVVNGEHWSLWQQSVGTAIDWLRAHTGATQVALIGLRIGATLAALAAERREDVAALIMLEPVLRGRSYLRQMMIEQMANRDRPAESSIGLDTHGLRWSSETMRRIEAVDLRQVRPPPACRVAIFAQTTSPILSGLLNTWQKSAAWITAAGFQGLEPFLQRTFRNHEGPADTARILDWLRHAVPPASRTAAVMPAGDYVPLAGDGWVETPLFFGSQKHLFGMLCRPTAQASTGPVVVILNASGDPHYGPGRLSAHLARHLARAGITSFRIDFAGIGDSADPDGGDAASHILETDREADITAAVDALEGVGYRRFALQGLCTGAYHALHGAVADRRVEAVLLVNLPMFTWRKGDRLDLIGVRSLTGQYLRNLADGTTWTQLRERRLSLFRPLRSWGGVLAVRWRALMARLAKRTVTRAQVSFGQRCLKILSGRQVRTLFLYAAEDTGLAMLEQEFAPAGIPPQAADLRILTGVDHVLSRSAMRQMAVDKMTDFLKQLPVS